MVLVKMVPLWHQFLEKKIFGGNFHCLGNTHMGNSILILIFTFGRSIRQKQVVKVQKSGYIPKITKIFFSIFFWFLGNSNTENTIFERILKFWPSVFEIWTLKIQNMLKLLQIFFFDFFDFLGKSTTENKILTKIFCFECSYIQKLMVKDELFSTK